MSDFGTIFVHSAMGTLIFLVNSMALHQKHLCILCTKIENVFLDGGNLSRMKQGSTHHLDVTFCLFLHVNELVILQKAMNCSCFAAIEMQLRWWLRVSKNQYYIVSNFTIS